MPSDPSTVADWSRTGFASTDQKNLHALHAGKTRSDTNNKVVCRDCHAALPHGTASTRALIVTQDDAKPYRDDEAGITTVDSWPSPQSWGAVKSANCSTVAGCH